MQDKNNLTNLKAKVVEFTKDRCLQIESMVPYKKSAVMVPLVEQDGQVCVLFEVRAKTLAFQPGEICFPGGRVEDNDPDFEQTVWRECSEELGLNAPDIEVIGALNPLNSPMGMEVYPYLGFINDLSKLQLNADEVEEVFTVPLDFFYNTEPRTTMSEVGTRSAQDFPHDLVPNYPREWKLRSKYKVYFYVYGEHVIWGLTAHILRLFLEKYKEVFKN